MVINRTVQKLLNLVKEFFGFKEVEFGIVDVSPCDNGREIFIAVERDVVAVWINVSVLTPPVCGGGVCYVSECTPVPNGFVFKVNVNSDCRVRWLAIVS